MSATTKQLAYGAVLVLGLAACGPVRQAASPERNAAPQQQAAPEQQVVQGLVAGPSSSAYPVEARNIRLVRSGERELALQFDLFNGTDKRISFGELGLDYQEQLVALVDPPRGTAYGPVNGSGRSARISEDADIEPGKSAPLTAVFAAPPKEATELLVVIDGVLPVMAPIQRDGLADDPVLTGPHAKAQSGALVCATTGPRGESFRLPSDVLFDFGSATLTPAAQAAIRALRERVTVPSGEVTVDGHTDGIGGKEPNQRLSERRAKAVHDALRGGLGDAFTYRADGHGETRPVAPNTRQDGTDDPGGRAQNRRVEISVAGETREAGRRSEATDLSDSGLVAEVSSARRLGGYLLASVTVSNPTSEVRALDFDNHFTPKELTTGQLSLSDGTARYDVCGFAEPTYFDFVGTLSQRYAPGGLGKVPAGASVTLWGLFPAPAQDTTSVKVEVAGFADTITADITAG